MKIETISSQDLTKHEQYDTMGVGAEYATTFCVTKITPAIRDQNRVNISINDKFFCSLDIAQLVDLKLKIGQKLGPSELKKLKSASDFGKLYTRALEYSLIRPHSEKEIHDYLTRKTYDRLVRVKDHKTNLYKTIKKPGYDASLVQPVLDRLKERGFIDDAKFAKNWVENRSITKGASRRRLEQELIKKGVKSAIIAEVLADTSRSDTTEIQKIIAKKRHKYDDQKLIQYLTRLGFDYNSAKTAVLETDSQNWA